VLLKVIPLSTCRVRVRDELEERLVRISEVDARARTSDAETLDRTRFDIDAVPCQVLMGFVDWTRPLEAQVAPA
jgi:hypothetical protein